VVITFIDDHKDRPTCLTNRMGRRSCGSPRPVSTTAAGRRGTGHFPDLPPVQINGNPGRPEHEIWYGQGGKGFGWGTVHHAAGSMRMPSRPSFNSPFSNKSVVDENLRLVGGRSLYACDMSVMPFSSAANPVRTLAALALRLSDHLA
jgi:choline dehydrogenase-like flavoprotein